MNKKSQICLVHSRNLRRTAAANDFTYILLIYSEFFRLLKSRAQFEYSQKPETLLDDDYLLSAHWLCL